MFKSIFVASLIAISATTSLANELQDNFEKCAAADPSWMNRWGQYVVGYELKTSYEICRHKNWPLTNFNVQRMGCKVDGATLLAGYYCAMH